MADEDSAGAAAAAAATRHLSGTDRGGVVGGYSPVHSSIQLYLIQIILIVTLCFILGHVVKKWNQPRVIAEVMAGVLLGPSALGAIPKFTDTIFPEHSIEALSLTAHLGLVMFLFIIGLELDPSLLRSNARRATLLSLVAQGFTWLLSLGVSHAMIAWMDDVRSSTSFILFIGVSLSVTAFPVLSRILTENHLLNTSVGALVISAASVDEACVWCLLALVVSTVNAGSPLDAFYVFLLLVFFLICMLTVVRLALLYAVRRIGGDEVGPPPRAVAILCFLLTLVSAWVTDFIGIDAIFGAFVAGIIVPREHSLHIRIVELLQDVVSVLLLPLYFAVSGLKTDITLLDNGVSWALTAITILAACAGKIVGGATVSRVVFGMTGRESLAVGVLMNTRGLVELIILNIGLDGGVLTKEVMAIMVVMALVTTFLTAPLAGWIYPLKYHTLPGSKFSRRAKLDTQAVKDDLSQPLNSIADLGRFAQERLKLLVLVSNASGLDTITRVTRLFNGNGRTNAGNEGASLGGPTSLASRGKDDTSGALVVHTLRLLENTDRFSSDMQALEKGETLNNDGLAGMLQTFLELLMIKVHSHISVGGPTDYCQDVRRLTEEHGISTVVFPWESRSTSPGHQIAQVERLMHTAQCQVIIALNCHTAALSTSSGKRLGIIVPFFGTEDDIAALLLALAIIQSDSSAEMVILSFLKPEKVDAAAAVAAATVAAAVGVSGIDTASGSRLGSGRVAGGSGRVGGSGTVGSDAKTENGDEVDQPGGLLNVFTPPKAQSPLHKDVDIEAPLSTSEKKTTTTSSLAAPSNKVNGDAEGRGRGTNPPRTIAELQKQKLQKDGFGCTWSGSELVNAAADLDRVTVTPAWTLQNALGAIASNPAAAAATTAAAAPASPSTSAAAAVAAHYSPSARIVYQLATSQGTDLVICGCTGSYNISREDEHRGVDGGDRRRAGTDSTSAPISMGNAREGAGENDQSHQHTTTQSQHRGSNRVSMSLGPLNISRHSLSFQTWHAGRISTGSRHGRNNANGTPARGARMRSLSRSNGSMPAAWYVAGDEGGPLGPHNELEPWVGDVIALLAHSQRAPAMLAVRASAF